jgi:hypothetical protein
MLDQLYEAWRADTERGLESLMITSESASAAVLNNRAHSEAVALGHVIGPIVTIADGTAGVGDRIVTRRNDRIINAGHTWVRNGDTWTVTAAATNGSIRARRDSDYAEVVLPADYVAEHVDLAYATTAYRVQGRTVDSAHALVRSTSSRETLYVGATRGRIGNTLYVDIEAGSDVASGHGQAAATAEHVLGQALHHIGSDAAAHTVRETESEPAPFLRQQANLATLPTPAPPPAEPTSSLPEI